MFDQHEFRSRSCTKLTRFYRRIIPLSPDKFPANWICEVFVYSLTEEMGCSSWNRYINNSAFARYYHDSGSGSSILLRLVSVIIMYKFSDTIQTASVGISDVYARVISVNNLQYIALGNTCAREFFAVLRACRTSRCGGNMSGLFDIPFCYLANVDFID